MTSLGQHVFAEFIGCKPEVLDNVLQIEDSMVFAAKKAGATVIDSVFHHFSPHGVSGVVILRESHLAIHTWPEYGYAAVDMFTCGTSVNPWISIDDLKGKFGGRNYSAKEINRGTIELLECLDSDIIDSWEQHRKNIGFKYKRNVWFTDGDENQVLSLRHTGEVFFNRTTQHQSIKVIETNEYGKALVINDMFMCTEKDEFHYHEMIVHPAVLSHGQAKKVLVVGGGDGGTIREIFKHKGIGHVDMVEIDEAVIEASKLYLPTLSTAFGHLKLNLIIGDGINYVKNVQDGNYDIIIVDGSDPVGPAKGLFSTRFHENCKRILAKNGLLVAQGESPQFNKNIFVEINSSLKTIFGNNKVFTLLFNAPTYPSGIWSIQIASNGNINPSVFNKTTAKEFVQNNILHYYNLDVHRGAFELPTYVKRMLHEQL